MYTVGEMYDLVVRNSNREREVMELAGRGAVEGGRCGEAVVDQTPGSVSCDDQS
jgi:hypothetical protein